ncbi:phosphoribulokinase 1 [Mycobacterium xenopi 4042]|uniref:Phosphoribulokinase 1 n=1 Tax=Mycobacterium xenopi 4042 TaxID=1299334 RepID=X7ZX83_MYCXE|nr:phosphoribulokinase 1 [Mycobacterium xenopi 4042]
MRTFEQIFRREGINVVYVEGDSFHRYDRAEMKTAIADAHARGDHTFSHFGLRLTSSRNSKSSSGRTVKAGQVRSASTCTTRRRPNHIASSPAHSHHGRIWRRIPTCCSTKAYTAPSLPRQSMLRATRTCVSVSSR